MEDKESRAYVEKLEFENQALREDMDTTIRNAKIFQAECRKLEKERDEAIAERDKLDSENDDLSEARVADTGMIAGLMEDLARVKAANVKLIEERDELRAALDSEKKNVCARCAGVASGAKVVNSDELKFKSLFARIDLIETWIKRVADAGKLPVSK